MTKLKINGLIKKPNWYAIKCCCSTIEDDDEHKYPLTPCLHHKFKEQEDSMPRKTFEINENLTDEKGKITKTTRTISEIQIIRGHRYQDIIGWVY